MNPNEKESLPALGFITVVKSRELGIMGGYLILNRNGRPVEFHCTAPVRATKSQHILFGPTLEPYIYGEQIARALTVRATISPKLILTDKLGVMALRQLTDIPMVLTEIPKPRKDSKKENTEHTQNTENSDIGNTNLVSMEELMEMPLQENSQKLQEVQKSQEDISNEIETLKGKIVPKFDDSIVVPEHSMIWNGVLLHPDKHFLDDIPQAEAFLREEEIEYDLAEPFERIREAIYEAQKSAA